MKMPLNITLRIRFPALIGFHRQRVYLGAQQDQAAFEPGVAGIAEFEAIGATQHPAPRFVAYQRPANAGNGVIEKLHLRDVAGTLTGIPRDLQRAQAVEPDPYSRGQ